MTVRDSSSHTAAWELVRAAPMALLTLATGCEPVEKVVSGPALNNHTNPSRYGATYTDQAHDARGVPDDHVQL